MVPQDEDDFYVHRKMLRRRYIRKEQKEQALKEDLLRQGERPPPSLQTHDSSEPPNQSTSSSRYNDLGQVSPTAALSGDAATSRANHRSGPTEETSSKGNGMVDVINIIVPPYSPLRCQKSRTLRF